MNLRNSSHISLIVFICLLITGCQTIPPDQVLSEYSDDSQLSQLCELYDIVWDWDQLSQVVTLRKGDALATTLIDSDLVLLNEEQVTIEEPLRLKRGAIIVSDDFKEKVIKQLKAQPSTNYINYVPNKTTKRRTIETRQKKTVSRNVSNRKNRSAKSHYKIQKLREVIIDAGHGGKDPGAIGHHGTNEKDVVLDISKRVKKILEGQGIKVHMTRDKDNFITLQDRTSFASKVKADAFISIHANSTKKRSVNGVEVFSLRNLSYNEKNDDKRKANKEILLKHLETDPKDTNIAFLVDEMLYDYKQSESLYLAQEMSVSLSRSLRARNRGRKTAGFYVLRNTFIPAVLIEVGFLSNPKEEKLLKSKKYRDKIARSIARSLLDYSKGK